MSRTMALMVRDNRALVATHDGANDREIQPWWDAFTLAEELRLPDQIADGDVTRIMLVHCAPPEPLSIAPYNHYAGMLQKATGCRIDLVSAHTALSAFHQHSLALTAETPLVTILVEDYQRGGGYITYNADCMRRVSFAPVHGDHSLLSRKSQLLGHQVATLLTKYPSHAAMVCVMSGPLPGVITLNDEEFTRQLAKVHPDWRDRVTVYTSPSEILQGALLVAATTE